MSVDCTSELNVEDDPLHAEKIKQWVSEIPDGAIVQGIYRDFGTQRDPDRRTVGLRATWSEQR